MLNDQIKPLPEVRRVENIQSKGIDTEEIKEKKQNKKIVMSDEIREKLGSIYFNPITGFQSSVNKLFDEAVKQFPEFKEDINKKNRLTKKLVQ